MTETKCIQLKITQGFVTWNGRIRMVCISKNISSNLSPRLQPDCF